MLKLVAQHAARRHTGDGCPSRSGDGRQPQVRNLEKLAKALGVVEVKAFFS
jgi:hypothetical protein